MVRAYKSQIVTNTASSYVWFGDLLGFSNPFKDLNAIRMAGGVRIFQSTRISDDKTNFGIRV